MERGWQPGTKQIVEVFTFLDLGLSEENLKSGSAFYYDMDPDPDFQFDTDPDPTVWYGSGSLPFQRGNVP